MKRENTSNKKWFVFDICSKFHFSLFSNHFNSFEIKELQQLSQSKSRDEGTGRPTKKDRREIDDLFIEQSEK